MVKAVNRLRWIIKLVFGILKALKHEYLLLTCSFLTYLHNAKAKLFIFRNSLAFIS